MIVVDTNVLSELSRSPRNPAVAAWARAQPGSGLYTTAITVAEIRFGVERIPAGRRKEATHAAVTEVLAPFEERVLPFDEADADAYARLVSDRERVGQPMSTFDALIAAVCLRHHAALATRNTRHFAGTGVDLVNPWEWRPA